MNFKNTFIFRCTILVLVCLTFSQTSNAGVIENTRIRIAISSFNKAKEKVSLGDNKKEVLAILQPTQKHLKGKDRKSFEAFYDENNQLIEIYYYRVGLEKDGLTSEEEFSPYIFVNGKLTAIGWTAIEGPRGPGQTVRIKH